VGCQNPIYYEVVSEAFETLTYREQPALGLKDQEFEEARDELPVEGRSQDGRIRLTACGLRSWSVQIDSGTLSYLTEQEFCSRLAEAGQGLIGQQYERVNALKDRIYQRRDN
jgi:hypothetical protein